MWRCVVKGVLVIGVLISGVSGACGEESDLAPLFTDRNVEGTIVISSLEGETFVYNKNRASKQYLPASTFKIPNTLIALDESVVADEKEIIKWDGVDKGWDVWNKDHCLATAFPVSCIWFYQALAKEIGNVKYLQHLEKINYGNKMTGDVLETFWLNGDLKISPLEQITFLKKLYAYALPYKKTQVDLLKKIMIVKETPEYVVRAKTGLSNQDTSFGWYVGYVESKGAVWFFATLIDIAKESDRAYRQEITMEALKTKKII